MMRKVLFYRGLIIAMFLLSVSVCVASSGSVNEEQARTLFNRTYQLVFGPNGSYLHYDVNLAGFYRTSGDIWYKGKKSRYLEKRYASWIDGVTAYMVDQKAKTVSIYKADSDKKNENMSKFKFNENDFEYSWSRSGGDFLLTLKLKKSHFMGIREVKALIDDPSYAPISLRIKVAFFWTTVKISRFRSGDVSDNVFVFPHNQFRTYRFIDKRNED